MAAAVPCANHAFCECTTTVGCPFCTTCGSWAEAGGFGFGRLEFEDNTKQEECVVCYDVPACFMQFPTRCGHAFCIPCSRSMLFFDEGRYHLSVESYGGPACPNGCKNPGRGLQCDCEARYAAEDDWEYEHPALYNAWQHDEEDSIALGETGSVYGQCICPMCRSEYCPQ